MSEVVGMGVQVKVRREDATIGLQRPRIVVRVGEGNTQRTTQTTTVATLVDEVGRPTDGAFLEESILQVDYSDTQIDLSISHDNSDPFTS